MTNSAATAWAVNDSTVGDTANHNPIHGGMNIAEAGDRRGGNPVGELHFLRLFANHDQQHEPEHDAGQDQHPPIRQATMGEEGQPGHDAAERQPEQRAAADDGLAHPQAARPT